VRVVARKRVPDEQETCLQDDLSGLFITTQKRKKTVPGSWEMVWLSNFGNFFKIIFLRRRPDV